MWRLLLLTFVCSTFTLGHSRWEQFYTPDREIHELEGMCLKEFANRIVYCHGAFIEAINYHRIFNDSKTFVDQPLKKPPQEIMDEFNKRFDSSDISRIDPTKLKGFMEEFMFPAGYELKNCTPSDWKPQPPKIMQIQDPKLRAWALELHEIWKTLCRRINPEVKQNKDLHSILWVDENFIVPGGRFQEFYYSDSYWIVKGLLISDMAETAKAITRNLASLVRSIGFIPNGGRVYYTNRSQPPLLISMVYAIYEETGDLDYVKKMLPDLEAEFDWWQKNRRFQVVSQSGTPQTVYFYKTGTSLPRPESMWADLQAADKMSKQDQQQFFESSASGAESGWDFSSRWFADQKTLRTMETARIAPADLNSFLCGNMAILGYFNREIGNSAQANHFETMHQNFIPINEDVFYNQSAGGWYDFNNRTRTHRVHNYPSVAVPLFMNCYNILDQNKPRRLFENFQKDGFFDYTGGVPASLIKDTNQQWDFPNGWAPLNHMLIEGLRQSSDPIMQDRAFEVAKKWLYSNYRVYEKTSHMFEKYDVIGEDSKPGGGGEYEVVIGFGWSNGVVLDLLYTYYDRIEAPVEEGQNPDTKTPAPNNHSQATVFSCTLLIILAAFLNSIF